MKSKTQLPIWIFWLSLFVIGVLLAWNNSLTVTADLTRNQIEFKNWHPYVWEFSSFLIIYILYFGVYWLANKFSLLNQNWLPNLFIHIIATVVFSILHVLLMVWIRQIIYALMGGQYEFGEGYSEWLYEYRKDVVTYFVFVMLLYAFQHLTQSKKPRSDSAVNQKLQVKNKQGVFWIKHADITTIESGGNYIYIHAGDQVLPMRSTMAKIEKELESSDFLRVHRSYLVNLNHCKAIQRQSTESSKLELLSGQVIPVSKNYRGKLLASLEQKLIKAVNIKS